MRLVKIRLPDGNLEILATSFLDKEVMPKEDLSKLYQKRWDVEENIKELKCRLEMPRFTGKSVEVIFQDIYSKVFIDNLVSLLCREAQEIIDKKTKHRKHDYAVNRTQAIRKTKHVIAKMLCFDQIQPILSQLIQSISKDCEPIRPGRRNPRKILSARRFHMNYKPI